MKFKIIKQKGRVFLIRFSFPKREGSIKIHIILNDDIGNPHKHPWFFKSILLIGAYKELVGNTLFKHRPLSIVRRNPNQKHKVILYKIMGRKIPCLTIGTYSKKVQPWCENTKLCDHCSPLGYCMDKKYWKCIK